VNQLIEAGITPMLHFDSNWDAYLDRFLELPRTQVILELDSATDIFKAKQILKGHLCLMGDVPASLLKLGTPEQVTDYCKKLIDVVGEGNGFILSTGCDCPVDAKPENFKAMIDTGKSYYPHQKLFTGVAVEH
jgi:uroporphyrinogen-III decarboxylase